MVYIFTQYDPFFKGEFLREFDKKNCKFTVIDMPNFKRGRFAGIRKAITLYGYVGFAKLLWLFVVKYAFVRLKNQEELVKIDSDTQVLNIFQQMQEDDVILSLSAPSRLPVEQIKVDIPKINFHCGALPKYAGMMPIFWQLFNEETFITVTMHDLAHDIDAGEIYGEYQMEARGSLFETSQSAKRLSAEIFADFLSSSKKLHLKNTSIRQAPQLRKFPTILQVRELAKKRKLI